jgi:hypothetical protein
MGKEAIVSYFKVLSYHLRRGTEKTTKTSVTLDMLQAKSQTASSSVRIRSANY